MPTATDCAIIPVPYTRADRWLRGHPTFRAARSIRTASQSSDNWREGCWWFSSFRGRKQDKSVDVVFALRLDPQSRDCRMVVVPQGQAYTAGT